MKENERERERKRKRRKKKRGPKGCRLLIDLGSGFRVMLLLQLCKLPPRLTPVKARSNSIKCATRLYLVQRKSVNGGLNGRLCSFGFRCQVFRVFRCSGLMV